MLTTYTYSITQFYIKVKCFLRFLSENHDFLCFTRYFVDFWSVSEEIP